MKLYTLTYDCNTPTKQQVNIPTNTDYKVGIKVMRNGQIQNLKPAEVKLYTGKSTVIEPTDFNADKELATSITGLVVALMPASISADLGGKTINTVVPEVSYDNGVTWGEVHVTVESDQYFLVMDKSQGNYYYARLNLKNPKSKWELLDGTATGVVSTADTITMPTNPQAFLNSNSSMWSITQFPCVFRLVIKYGGYTNYEYVSPDDGLTNGYTTFTLSAGDDASYTQETIDIQHGYEESYLTSNIIQNTTGANLTATFLSVDLSEYAGTTIHATDVKLAGIQRSAEITEDDLKESMMLYWDAEGTFFQAATELIVDNNGTPKIYVLGQVTKLDALNALGWPTDKPAFFGVDPDGQHYKMYETYTIQEGDKLIIGPNRRLRANQYGGARFQFTVGTPFDAKFKLNTNIFKSQQGDLSEPSIGQTTVNISGKFSDNTDFDYDFVVA